MPSLPTSLILVGLVVAWLVVLVPMVAKRRERVPENLEDGASFRVLSRDSARSRRRPVLSRTAMARLDDAHAVDPEADAEADGAGIADDAGDVAFDEVSGTAGHARAEDDSDDGAHDDADDTDVVEAGRAYDVVSADSRDGGDARRDADAVSGARVEAAVRLSNERDAAEVRDAADDWRREHPVRAAREQASWQREPRADLRPQEDRPVESVSRGGRGESGEGERAVDDAALYRSAPVRPGRGGFDPRAAERARALRFRQRRRIALVLGALMVAGVPVGLLGTGYGWVGTAVAGVLLVLYLAYLRRQVRIEEAIRQRRAARLTRAQQIRPSYRPSVAEQVRAHRTGGASSAEDPAPELEYRVRSHVRPTVPPSLYRRGTPVDLEDSDPAFDDLEYYRPAAYRRRAG